MLLGSFTGNSPFGRFILRGTNTLHHGKIISQRFLLPSSKWLSESSDRCSRGSNKYVLFPCNLPQFQTMSEENAEMAYKSMFQPMRITDETKKPLWDRILKIGSKFYLMEASAIQIYEYTCAHVENKDFYHLYDLEPNFMNWLCLIHLHVWMLIVRTRNEGYSGVRYQRRLFHSYWTDIEKRVIGHGVTQTILLGKELKRILRIYHACVVAYDDGLIHGDMVFSDALWRDFFCGNTSIRSTQLELV